MSDEHAAVEIVQDDSGWTWEVQVGDRRWNGLSESFSRAADECLRYLREPVSPAFAAAVENGERTEAMAQAMERGRRA